MSLSSKFVIKLYLDRISSSIFCISLLTAMVLTALWRAAKKNGSARSRITVAREEQKRSRCFERTLLIKDFKYGSSLSVFVQKNNKAQQLQVSQFLPLDNNTTAEFDSGSKFKE